MSGDTFQSFKGHFLLAMPSMKDPTFSRAVVYLCEHSVDGAMGFIVNRPSHLMAALDIYQEFNLDYVDSATNVPVYTGGPVQLDELFLLHGPPFDCDGTYPLGDEVALSNSMATLSAVAKGEGPAKVAIFFGSSGWAAGQLEGELAGNVWLTVESGSDLIFEVPADKRWENALDRLGIDPVLLSGDFGRA